MQSKLITRCNYTMSKSGLITLTITLLLITGAIANDQKSSKLSSLSGATAEHLRGKNNNGQELYIDNDDDDFEGSGTRSEIKEDLVDGDDESSGSGFGGDDEDEPSQRRPTDPRIDQRPKEPNIHQSGDGHTDSDEDYYDEKEPHTELDSEKDNKADSDFTFDTATTETSSTSSTSTTTQTFATDDEDIGIDDNNSKKKDTEHSRGSFDTDSTHHVPVHPTETSSDNGVLIMDSEGRPTNFFAQPGILAAVIGGAVVGLLFAILVVMFIVYRMRKKDEGSYALDEPKRSPQSNSYSKNHNNREFYA